MHDRLLSTKYTISVSDCLCTNLRIRRLFLNNHRDFCLTLIPTLIFRQMKAPVTSTFAVIASNNEVNTSVLEYCITQLHYIVTGGAEKKVGCTKFFFKIFLNAYLER